VTLQRRKPPPAFVCLPCVWFGSLYEKSKNFLDFNTVAVSFLFDKYYLIIDLKDSSHDL